MQNNDKTQICSSWLSGKYTNGEINTLMPYLAVNEPDFFMQGDEAQKVIDEMIRFWCNNENLTSEQVFDYWVFHNL